VTRFQTRHRKCLLSLSSYLVRQFFFEVVGLKRMVTKIPIKKCLNVYRPTLRLIQQNTGWWGGGYFATQPEEPPLPILRDSYTQ